MIKGVKRKGKEYDGKFDPEMGIFLGSFSSIIQTSSDSSTRFNNSESPSELKSLLNNEFESAKAELIETLLNTYLKLDKLNLLSEIAIEIKTLKRLMVNNPIDESYSQEDCNCLKEVLEKMNDFIEGQKQIFESTNQNDYPVPYYMIPDKEASSFEKPLHYFEYLFNRNGLEYLRNNFIQYYSSDDYADSTYDKETETVTHNHYDIETGEWSETFSDFKSFFDERLETEYYISKKLIDDYVDEQKEEAVVVFFIKRTLDKLNSLLSKIADSAEALKYNNSKRPINALIQHIHKKYKIFVDDKKIALKNITEIHKSFKLIGTQAAIKNKAIDLHTSLFINKYVTLECKKDFIKIFTGQQPENKIVWNGLKGELKLFINLLSEKGKIEDCKSNKWKITAANFKFPNEDFISTAIKDTKEAKNDIKLTNIATKI